MEYDKVLPNVDKGHLSYDFRSEYQKVLDDKGNQEEYDRRAKEIEDQLMLCGVPMMNITMIMDKYISELSYQDLADKYFFSSRHAARRYLQSIISEIQANKSIRHILKQSILGLGEF